MSFRGEVSNVVVAGWGSIESDGESAFTSTAKVGSRRFRTNRTPTKDKDRMMDLPVKVPILPPSVTYHCLRSVTEVAIL